MELAVANADGLVDDQEYRMLRGQLFERYASQTARSSADPSSALGEGKESVPRLHAPAPLKPSTTPPRATSAPNTPSRPPTSPSKHLHPPKPARPASFMSTASRASRGFGSLFRRSSKSTLSEYGDNDEFGGPLEDLAGPARSRTSTMRHPGVAALSPRDGRFVGSSRSSHAGESVFSGGTSMQGGSMYGGARSSIYDAGGARAGSFRTGGAGTTIHHPLSINENEAATSLPLPPIASSADPFLFASSEREPTSAELRKEIREIELEWKRLAESWDGLVGARESLEEREEVMRRRALTDEKYRKRIEYLKARLQGALIRERIPR
ncbi:hypothetical protein MNV49_004644 [Pseudohyphozyma bogoriensis]|nr:hypothetical protein MNV49_004644 [Pseudohyphozyma bogoriensis]